MHHQLILWLEDDADGGPSERAVHAAAALLCHGWDDDSPAGALRCEVLLRVTMTLNGCHDPQVALRGWRLAALAFAAFAAPRKLQVGWSHCNHSIRARLKEEAPQPFLRQHITTARDEGPAAAVPAVEAAEAAFEVGCSQCYNSIRASGGGRV